MVFAKKTLEIKGLYRDCFSIYRTQVFLDWVKSVNSDYKLWDLKTFNDRPTLLLVDDVDQNEEGVQINSCWKEALKHELTQQLYIDSKHWPKLTRNLFDKWFTLKYHDCVLDFSSKELKHWVEPYEGI